ncbi:hypothetical protein KTD26_34215 [Burkholderia multivorans]|uniref:hypothetical protein n=1 Tax=Burkholderia multivorans TaxID=87883 RepID=UPI001C22CAC8|nr:hypothetical protein [Burkholderia multivorans]MBU9147510.1 hypothetical protein [Burkholderia multivorans]
MSIFIANCTKQHLDHHFRSPEHAGKAQVVHIPSGQQREIARGASSAAIEALVRHLEQFGFRNAEEVNGKISEFSGYLYRIGKPVTETHIVTGHDQLVDTQERRSAQEATRSALAFDSATRDKKGRRMASVTSVEVKQDVPPGQKPTGDEVNFSLSVTPEGRADAKLPV